jgi:2'-5' RNA ligase superfamily
MREPSEQRTLSLMPSDGLESAVIVRVSIPPAIERIRRRWDYAAAAGVPAHVTILYPFLPPDELRATVRGELLAPAAVVEPFDVRFAAVGRFPTVVYLAPEPAAPFAALTSAVTARFPDYPPYGGTIDQVIHHLTVVESPTVALDGIARDVKPFLPFERHVTTLELIVEGSDGRWRLRWRIPLGIRR